MFPCCSFTYRIAGEVYVYSNPHKALYGVAPHRRTNLYCLRRCALYGTLLSIAISGGMGFGRYADGLLPPPQPSPTGGGSCSVGGLALTQPPVPHRGSFWWCPEMYAVSGGDEIALAVNLRTLPLPNPPPGPTQNADAFCVGTRPLRVLTHPAREGANWRNIGNGWFCRSAGCQHTFQDTISFFISTVCCRHPALTGCLRRLYRVPPARRGRRGSFLWQRRRGRRAGCASLARCTFGCAGGLRF